MTKTQGPERIDREVFGALITVGSVRTLPFLPKLVSSYQGTQ